MKAADSAEIPTAVEADLGHEEISAVRAKCTRQSAQTAAKNAKSHSSLATMQKETQDRSTAKIATRTTGLLE
jgi:hypothetical protein